MDTAEAAIRIADIELLARKTRDAFGAMEDAAMRYQLRNIIVNAKLIIEWSEQVEMEVV